jgi:hypothetical protein
MKQLVYLCAFAIGCSSPTNQAPDAAGHSRDAPATTNAVVGTIAGNSYPIAEAVSFADHASDGNGLVIMSTMPGVCARLAADTIDPNERLITIAMSDSTPTSGSPPSSPGTYTVSTMTTPHFGAISSDAFDANCAHLDIQSVNATSGSIQLLSVDGNVFTGTFDVSFSVTGDHITGSFSPTSCPGLVGVPTRPSKCM